jgi:nitrogen regulatory protein P-II 1
MKVHKSVKKRKKEVNEMKKIEAIIRREKLDDVMNALEAIKTTGVMIWDIEGYGKQKGITEKFRGTEFNVRLMPKARVEIVLPASKVKETVSVIIKAAGTGSVGDGKIFISEIEDAIRIRTGEKGEEVVS